MPLGIELSPKGKRTLNFGAIIASLGDGSGLTSTSGHPMVIPAGAREVALVGKLLRRRNCRAALKGDPCRCTGYQFIVNAVERAAEQMGESAPQREAGDE